MLLISVREFFLPYALFHGKLYVDCDNLSFTRVEMDLDMQNKSKAIAAILHQKATWVEIQTTGIIFSDYL